MELPSELFWSRQGRFPHPDWDGLAVYVETSEDPALLDAAWSEVARQWMRLFAGALGEGYQVHQGGRFLLVARADDRRAREVLMFLDDCHARMLRSLPFVDETGLYGKLIAIVFGDEQEFYEYLADFQQEDGEYGMAGAVYLNHGYGHFAMPSLDLAEYQAQMCHELCHALLAVQDLPLWLDEAITAEIEHQLVGRNPYLLDRLIIREHREYWNAERLEAFWRGASFSFPDEGQGLSYHLARFIFKSLADRSTPESMIRFVNSAHYEDAGFAGAREVFGTDPAEIVGELLG